MLIIKEINRLLAIMLHGDNDKCIAAYEKIYKYYYKILRDYSVFRLYDSIEAEDIVQDILADVWINKQILLDNKVTDKESFDTYLIEKATGKIANLNKKYDRIVSLEEANIEEKKILDNFVFDDDLERVELKEYSEIMDNVIKELPAPLRFTFYLLFNKQYSEYQTARVLGTSVHQVKLYLCDIQKNIGKKLKKYYSFDFDIGKRDLKNSI